MHRITSLLLKHKPRYWLNIFFLFFPHKHNYTHALVAVNQCEVPTKLVNGNITFEDDDPANILPGDMIEYACSEGTELQGPQYRFCQRNGNWSDEQPQCIGERKMFSKLPILTHTCVLLWTTVP